MAKLAVVIFMMAALLYVLAPNLSWGSSVNRAIDPANLPGRLSAA